MWTDWSLCSQESLAATSGAPKPVKCVVHLRVRFVGSLDTLVSRAVPGIVLWTCTVAANWGANCNHWYCTIQHFWIARRTNYTSAEQHLTCTRCPWHLLASLLFSRVSLAMLPEPYPNRWPHHRPWRKRKWSWKCTIINGTENPELCLQQLRYSFTEYKTKRMENGQKYCRKFCPRHQTIQYIA